MEEKYKYMSMDELWARIKHEWVTTDATYSELEKKYGIRKTTIRSRRSREGWVKAELIDKKEKVAIKMPTPEKVIEDRPSRDRQVEMEDINPELTDKERLFCLHYMRQFNAVRAYMKAYGVSHATATALAHKAMKRPHIQDELDRLKREQSVALKLDAQDVLQQYIDIAFADITDFVTFGTEEIEELNEKGKPTGKVLRRGYVDFKDSAVIDGMVVSEVKLGKDGIGIKMHDKMKALEQLTKYFDLLDDRTQKRLQNEKIKMETAKLKAEAGEGADGGQKTIILSGEDQMRAYMARQEQKAKE